MKIYIHFKFSKNGGGGGNFLSLLRKTFEEKLIYTSDPESSDVILYNSHHCCEDIIGLWKRYPDKVFIHRVDGPMKLYNDSYDVRDDIVAMLNYFVSDGTVFQSRWSMAMAPELMRNSNFKTVIHNAAAEPGASEFKNSFFSTRTRVLVSSWSDNPNKGFSDIRWLDENLDFSKYEVHFVGNTREKFSNIRSLPSKSHEEFLCMLKDYEILFFPSKFEACSNLLIEAFQNGLPVVALDSSSNRELVRTGGELYTHVTQIPLMMKKVSQNLETYRKGIRIGNMESISENYYQFCSYVVRNHIRKKIPSLWKVIYLRVMLKIFRTYEKIYCYIKNELKMAFEKTGKRDDGQSI